MQERDRVGQNEEPVMIFSFSWWQKIFMVVNRYCGDKWPLITRKMSFVGGKCFWCRYEIKSQLVFSGKTQFNDTEFPHLLKTRSSHRRCSVEMVFLEISQNSQEKPVSESLFKKSCRLIFLSHLLYLIMSRTCLRVNLYSIVA